MDSSYVDNSYVDNSSVDNSYVTCMVRNIFMDLGFIGNRLNGNGYWAYERMAKDKRDCGSVSNREGVVSYYINGHMGFVSGRTWKGEKSEKQVREEIEKYTWENRDKLLHEESMARLKSSVASYYKCRR